MHFVHVGRHPNPTTPLAYAKVTMGSVAEAQRVVQSLDGVPVPQLSGSNELRVKFGRVTVAPSATAAGGPHSPRHGPAGSPRAHSSGGAGLGAAGAVNGASSPGAGGGDGTASAPRTTAAQRCGSCGLHEGPDLALRRCSACKAVACEQGMGRGAALAIGALFQRCSC